MLVFHLLKTESRNLLSNFNKNRNYWEIEYNTPLGIWNSRKPGKYCLIMIKVMICSKLEGYSSEFLVFLSKQL